MIKYGQNKVAAMYYGDKAVRLMYQGSNKVFSQDCLFGCGNNSSGQLGFASPETNPYFVKCPVGVSWKQVSCGSQHTAAIDSDGYLYTMGYNIQGQLGLGDTFERKTPTKVGAANNWVKVACYDSSTMCLNSLGELWAAGYNPFYQLGMASGSYTTLTKVPFPTGVTRWVDFGLGGDYSVALDDSGQLYGTGKNTYGCLLSFSGTTTSYKSLLPGCKKVFCGRYSTFVIGTDNALYGFGHNASRQLGLNTGDTVSAKTLILDSSYRISKVSSGWMHTLLLTEDKKIYVCGSNTRGQLAQPSTGNVVTPVLLSGDTAWVGCSAHGQSSMLISEDGALFAAGLPNSLGLGGSDIGDVTTFTKVGNVINVSDASGSQFHSVVISN